MCCVDWEPHLFSRAAPPRKESMPSFISPLTRDEERERERERASEREREWVDWVRVSWNWKPILSDAFLFEISAKETLDRVTWFRAREIVQHNFPRVSIYFDIRLMD